MIIFCPAYGGHQDHDVANFICSRLKKNCMIYEFAEYNYFEKLIIIIFSISTEKDKVIFLTSSEKRKRKASKNI